MWQGGVELLNHMVRIVALLCLAQTRNAHVLLSVDELEFTQGVLGKPLVDELTETTKSRDRLLKVTYGHGWLQLPAS